MSSWRTHDALVDIFIAERLFYHTTHVHAHTGKKLPTVRIQITPWVIWSFTWRLAFGMVVSVPAIAACVTLILLPLGILLFVLATMPLRRFFKAMILAKVAAAHAAKKSKKKKKGKP